MSLTDTRLRALKPRARVYRIADRDGLCIEVRTTGARLWRFRYRFAGKPQMIGLGEYPAVSLLDARRRLAQARRELAAGVDPAAARRTHRFAHGATFGTVAAEWLGRQRGAIAATTYRKTRVLLGHAEALNARPIAAITPPEILAVLRIVEATGAIDTAHRVKQRICIVMRYAIATGRLERDPTTDLRGALVPLVSTPRAAITNPSLIGDLLRALDSYTGQSVTRAALRLAPLLFVRPGNLRAMEWAELDLDGAEWRIPAGKMKMREEHVVPLASQAVAILRDLHKLTGDGRYCFPSLRTSNRPMSDVTVNAALRRMGYDKHTMTAHGFRALASTRLNELGWAPDVIERQLAHAERNRVRAVYNRAQYLAQRRKMMQAWADYLDTLRNDRKVIRLRA